MKTTLLVATALLVAAACGGDVAPKQPLPISVNNSTTPTSDAGTGNNVSTQDTGPDVVPDATMSSQDAPTIIELGASPSTLSEGGSTLVSAIVTDPQGVDDIVAGRLLDGQTMDLIGNFRSIGGGSFEIDVDWTTLDSVRTITFGPNGTQRSLTAEFIDNSNERSTRSLSITLTCGGDPACDGACGFEVCNGECLSPEFDYESDENCGGCGVVCEIGQTCDGLSCVDAATVNEPCVEQSECTIPGGFCATEQEFGIPDGACVVICQDSDACPTGAVCAAVFNAQIGETQLCGEVCTSSSQCRPGWACSQVDTDLGLRDACVPDSF